MIPPFECYPSRSESEHFNGPAYPVLSASLACVDTIVHDHAFTGRAIGGES
jgi:hypothetical protein